MSFCALINLYSDMRFHGPAAVTFNNVYALIFSALLFFGPIILVIYLAKSLRVLDKDIDEVIEQVKIDEEKRVREETEAKKANFILQIKNDNKDLE